MAARGMTETKWLGSTKPAAMLRSLKGKASERKLRLFAVAVHREYHRTDPRSSWLASGLAVDVAEALAETGGSEEGTDRSRFGVYFVLFSSAYDAASRLVDNYDVPDAFKCGGLGLGTRHGPAHLPAVRHARELPEVESPASTTSEVAGVT